MSNPAMIPPLPSPGGPASEPAPAEGGSPLGKMVGRLATIPMRRWKLSLLCAVVSLGIAGAATFFLSTTTHPIKGFGTYKPRVLPDDSKEFHQPLDIKTVRELAESPLPFVRLSEEVGLPPELLAKLFTPDETVDPTSDAIGIKLDWEGEEARGKELVNRFLVILQEEVAKMRRQEIRDSLASIALRLEDAKRKSEEADKAYRTFLRDKGIAGDPKTEVVRWSGEFDSLRKEIDTAKSRKATREERLSSLQAEIRVLIDKQKKGVVAAGMADPEFQKERNELRRQMGAEQTKLENYETRLIDLRKDREKLEFLVERRLRKQSDLDAVVLQIKTLEGAAEQTKKSIELYREDLKRLQPLATAIQEAEKEKKVAEEELRALEVEIKQKEKQQASVRQLLDEAQKVQAAAAPLNDLRESARKNYDRLDGIKRELERLADNQNPEVTIQEAQRADFSFSANRKKVFAIAMAVPLVLFFGLMVGFDVSTASYRAESLSASLGLPVLARAESGAPAMPGGRTGQLSASEYRALSLRLRQYAPGQGAVLMLTPLNEDPGVDRLAADLGGYFALRDERVLVLDARIANPPSEALQRAFARAPGGGPRGAVHITDQVGGRKGLVQYLVFEGQSARNLIVPTRTPGVDYLPAGGPYPATDALASEPMRDLLDGLRNRYTLILLLGPAVSQTTDTELLAAYADGLVFLVNGPLGSFNPATREFFKSLKEAAFPLLGSVLCV